MPPQETLSTAFATITSLASAFSTGREVSATQQNLEEFKQWLQTQGHPELLAQLESSHATGIYVTQPALCPAPQ